jgi:tetratricopeptide (TPR) repeat protein
MRLQFHRTIFVICAIAFLAIRVAAVDTNSSAGTTNDLTAATLLQIQEELHTTQLTIQQNQQAAADASRNNAELLAAQMQSLAQAVNEQRNSDAETTHKTLQSALLVMGVFGLVCLAVMLVMVYLQSRAFTQLTQISSQQQAVLANANAIHQLAVPGRVAVENSSAKLLDVVGQLKERINKLEGGTEPAPVRGTENGSESGKEGNGHQGPKISNGSNGKTHADLLAEGQRYLDENVPQKALELFDRFLAAYPDHADALLRKADALQKIGRNEEALAYYNRVIAKDSTLAVAHLQKGGLLNRLRRYDEALNCYEQALQAQERRRR